MEFLLVSMCCDLGVPAVSLAQALEFPWSFCWCQCVVTQPLPWGSCCVAGSSLGVPVEFLLVSMSMCCDTAIALGFLLCRWLKPWSSRGVSAGVNVL